MTVQEIGKKLVDYIQKGEDLSAYNELFSNNAIAVEPRLPGFERVEGLENIRNKYTALSSAIQELKYREISDVLLTAEKHIALNIKLEALLKDGSTFKVDEICLYEIEDGKIISEQFFY